MQSIILALALAAAAFAAPVPQSDSSSTTISATFNVAFKVDGTYLSANAVANGTSADLVIMGQDLSVSAGTPAYLNGTSPKAALVFDLSDSNDSSVPAGLYGASAAELGVIYGEALDVLAVLNYQQFEWAVNDGEISFSDVTDAFDAFFACEDTVNGEPAYVLTWGVSQQNGLPPAGCVSTSVVQNFNGSAF